VTLQARAAASAHHPMISSAVMAEPWHLGQHSDRQQHRMIRGPS
jgi:hypothetical protein